MKMNDNRYIRAMEHIVPDEDFERRTLNKLNASRRPGRRAARILIPCTAALACVLVLAIALPSMLAMPPVPAPDQSEPNGSLPPPMPAPAARSKGAAPVSEAAGMPGLAEYDAAWEGAFMMAPGSYEPFNTEEYAAVSESGFRVASTSPLSTFAADVDTAGYTNVRRMLLEGSLPDADSVRIEEMLNYFGYKGLAPVDGAPAAIHTALAPCPWNDKAALLFVGVGARAIEAEKLPPSNLVFLVDVSGSMDDANKLGLVKQGFALFTETLRPEDTVSIVTYAGSDQVVLEGVRGSSRGEILEAVETMTAWGSTHGSAGINTAYEIAQKYFIPGGNNRIILMTDGDLNVGTTSEAALTKLIEEKRKTGVFLSVMGFGSGNLKDNKLEALADNGNGHYNYIDSLIEAKRALVTQMGANFFTVCKDVKLQVEFNPAVVDSYRLIGYENRLLAAEDFADDTKDGGEMGSGHTVVALYELIPAEGARILGIQGTAASAAPDLRYQTGTATGSGELTQVSLRYKEPEGETSSLIRCIVEPDQAAAGDMARNLDLASAVAQFGMLLRDSEYKGTASFDDAAALVRSLPDLSDEETELAYLVTRAKALKGEDGGRQGAVGE
jgi:Ca-activated chloride channel family protein